ncbi:MAG: hypothetical protein WD342_00710 [Verrucomicrobiales bacterium]
MKISVPLESDDQGYIDRECPAAPHCEFPFKVHEDDWLNLFRDEAVYCPQCRHEAPSNQWFSKDQVEHLRREALNQAKGSLHDALRDMAWSFNRGQRRDSLITMSLQVTGSRPRSFVLPASAAEALMLEVACEDCGARFAVIGAAFFCPCCGDNSADRMFDDALKKVLIKIDSLPGLRSVVEETQGKDASALLSRSLVESGLGECVGAFQRFCEQVYERISPVEKIRRNVFQRLGDASNLWRDKLGEGYENWLTADELRELKIFYQRRHLLAHQEGIVDEDYARKSGDTTYAVGQRLVVAEADVTRMVELMGQLGREIRMRASEVPRSDAPRA